MTLLGKLTGNRDVLLFTTLAFIWGSSFLAIKVGLAAIPPLLFAALRYDVAGLVLLGLALTRTRQWRPRTREEWTLVSAGGLLLIGVHFALLFSGQQYVTSATGAIIMSTIPMLTPLFARFVLPDERVGRAGGIGILLGLVGVVVLANPDPSALGGQAVGVALMLLSAASFAFGSVVTQRLPGRLPIATMQAWVMLLGAGLLHALHSLAGEPTLASVAWTPENLTALAYLAVVAGAGGFLIYFHLLDRLGPVEISLVNYAVPVFAALTGWVLLGESIGFATVGGFAFVLAGFSLMKWSTVFPHVVGFQARVNRGYTAENEYVADAVDAEPVASGIAPADD